MTDSLFNPVYIPRELKEISRWVCWRADVRPDGRIDKLPLHKFNPNKKVNSLENCESWETITKKIFRTPFLGLGFYPDSDHTGLVGIDLDHVWEGSEMREGAQKLVKMFDSYTEFSPSKNGLHIWIRSKFSPSNHNGKPCEIKSKGNSYLTVTGWTYGLVKPIEDRTEVLKEVLDEYFPEQKPIKTEAELHREWLFLSDDDGNTLRKLWSNPERAKLWEGDLSSYCGDHSRGDLALCNFIYWCSDCDPDAIDRLFRRSALMRDKWDEVHSGDGLTYGQMTIRTVLAGR